MKRRDALKTIAIITAGTAILPACKSGETSEAAMQFKHISVSGTDQEMLAELSESLIPKTKDFIGAKDIKAHEFVLKMMDDCQPPEVQKVFSDGLKEFKDRCNKKYNTSFSKLSPDQKKELFKELEVSSKDETNKAARFYNGVKGYTIQCFTSSKQYMVDIRKYKLVPGSNFKGCVKA